VLLKPSLLFLNFQKKKRIKSENNKEFGEQGYRVLGVAKSHFEGNNFPENSRILDLNF
jgi:Ca2+-transporting ATPase